MPRIGIIKNENKLLETKTAFFADYFNFYADKIGKYYETELENPLSLVEKIIFQITTNPHNNKVNYINNYLTHDYFVNDRFLKQFQSYSMLKSKIILFKNINSANTHPNKAAIKWLNKNNDFLRSLQNLRLELQNQMFEKSLKYLISFLLCKHDLKKHQSDIKYYTKILVTELFFAGRSKSNILDIFFRILSKNIKKFPFPANVQTNVEKTNYLKESNFEKQFGGLLDFLKEKSRTQFAILKVYGAFMNNKSSFKYDEVEFLGHRHKKVNILRDRIIKHLGSIASNFFKGNDYVFAVIPIQIFNETPIMESAIKILQKEVTYVSLIINKYLRIDGDSYLLTSDFKDLGWQLKGNQGIKEISNEDIDNLKDNPFFFLKKHSGPSSDYFLKHENIFIGASMNIEVEGYWKYIENLFPLRSIDDIINITSSLLLLNEKLVRKNHVLNYLLTTTIPWQFNYTQFGLRADELVLLRKDLQKSKSKNFFKMIDYPFLNELKTIQTKRHTKKRYQEIKNYYSRILIELYESRNSLIHANTINKKADVKLQYCAPHVISRLRWVLLSYIKKSPKLEFNSLINKALVEANKLLP